MRQSISCVTQCLTPPIRMKVTRCSIQIVGGKPGTPDALGIEMQKRLAIPGTERRLAPKPYMDHACNCTALRSMQPINHKAAVNLLRISGTTANASAQRSATSKGSDTRCSRKVPLTSCCLTPSHADIADTPGPLNVR